MEKDNPVIDLSDEAQIEAARKKLDRKRFNEIKKYIPFLRFITAKDPIKNAKYVKLLQWFNSNKELPARVATTCEIAINKRYQTLKPTMKFPQHIISIFEGGEEAIDLISDDDDVPGPSGYKDPSKKATENKTQNTSKSINGKKSAIVENGESSKASTNTKNKVNDPKPSMSTTKCIQNGSAIEEGEVISDCEIVFSSDDEEDIRTKTHNISLTEISLRKTPTKQTEDSTALGNVNDDIINQELFNKIDNLAGEPAQPVATPELSWKDLEKEDLNQHKKSPVLRPKNLESQRRKSPDLLSNVSDDDNVFDGRPVQRKKKRKHKHKKRHNHGSDESETENHHSEKHKTHKEHKEHGKQKKCSKKRPVYISDDDDEILNSTPNTTSNATSTSTSNGISNAPAKAIQNDLLNATSNVNVPSPVERESTPESKLFQRRDLPTKEQETSTSDTVTVVLLDSDEDEINTPPTTVLETNAKLKMSPVPEPQRSPNHTTRVSTPNPIVVEKTSATNVLATKKEVELSSPSKLKDLNNMGLNELNDIYSKLCERTGIQLEQLLGDLVTKSAILIEDDEPQPIRNAKICSSEFNNFNNNVISSEDCLDSYELMEEENFQQQQLHHQNLHLQQQQQLHQQNLHYHQQNEQQQHFQQHQQHLHHQQQQQQHQMQQQQFSNHMHCPPNQMHSNGPYPYQNNNLMPKLNLNDPRIVQKLKQIQDSPIHNLSIRESAKLLVNNCYTQRPQPVVKVNSNTATTYGEHKRLKELEKKQKLERKIAKENEERERKQSPAIVTEEAPQAEVTAQTVGTNKKNRKSSSGSESSKTSSKSKKNTKASPNNSLASSRKNSSASESGRKTPKSASEGTDEETVVMSFAGKPRPRQRIISTSSSASNDTIDFQPNRPNGVLSSELEKVVKIVISALGKTPTKSRKNSTRKSTDSTKSDAKSTNNNADASETHEEPNNAEETLTNGKTKAKRRSRRSKTIDQSINKTPTKAKPKRGCRELDNLNCTFKEYKNMFEKCLLETTVDGKRVNSSSSNSKKQIQFGSSDGLNRKSTKKILQNNNGDLEPAICKQTQPQPAPISRRRQTCSALQSPPNESNTKSAGPIRVCFRRLSGSDRFSCETKNETDSSAETDEFDIEEHCQIKSEVQKTYKNIETDPFDPFLRVTLERLSTSEIMKWTKLEEDKKPPIKCWDPATVVSITSLKVHKPEFTVIPKPKIDLPDKQIKKSSSSKEEYGEMPILVPFTSKPVNTPKKTAAKAPIRLNDDINMTLNSTKTCVLCNKRPNDLTNHYVVQHQSESYTSRISTAQIEHLESNINLAIPHRNRFRVKCPFCPEQDELEDNFVNFHAHFSFHTGEYGFRCDGCDLVKPFREDISCHQKRSSTCRNGKIRSNYLYSPDLVVIYLYVCNLCNFVQLNEANIYKHHRDHHSIRFADPQNVKKCILAAIDNGEVVNEMMPTDREEEELTNSEGKNTHNVEQEFLSEFPLDIKDVVVTEEQLELPSTSELSSFENLLQEINVDNEALASSAPASPEEMFEQLHAQTTEPDSNSIITVIHTSKEGSYQESHKPYVEEVDKKPQVAELTTESAAVERVQPRMTYRKMPPVSNYFGMYKCTLNDCWFSTNEADNFYNHMSSAHANRKIFLDCAYCPFKSTKAKNIVVHVRSKHSMCRYQCSECAYRSTIPGNVAIHRSVCHKDSNSVKGIYECASRVKELDEKLNELSQKMIDNVGSLKCPDCPKYFYAVSSIKAHIRRAHLQTFKKLDPMAFHELACIHCKEESSSKEDMRMHLALDHPDEIGYVAERKLKTSICVDALSNLCLINISLAVTPNDIHEAVTEEYDNPANTVINNDDSNTDSQTSFDDSGPPSKAIKLMQTATVPKPNNLQIQMDEDVALLLPEESSTRVPPVTVTEQEKSLRPLLELLTEHTGMPASSLYRCPQCIASFLHFDLWKKHITTRHQINDAVPCPYCSKKFKIDLAAMHFESHRRHEYICFHCTASFCSREKICEHFASIHSDFRTTIERKISFVDASFYVFKEKDVSVGVVDWLPLFKQLSDSLRNQFKTKLQQNQQKEWWGGMTERCREDLPQYFTNGQPRYKCLVRSCPFVGLDEHTLDVHMGVHDAPTNYKCSHCLINQRNPTWEEMKNHKMLHKQELHVCCVCKFFHHTFSEMLKHIEQLHKIRDVPVVSMWRDETSHKISVAIFLPENKMSFATSDTCFCCKQVIKNNAKLVHHLKKEHKVRLAPKCQICDEILFTRHDAEVHANVHEMETFKLKFELLTPFMYNVLVRSTIPFTFETRLKSEKRPSEDLEASTSKKPKPDEEVVIKTECEEIVDETPPPSASIKCVNLQNLIRNEPNVIQPGSISVRPISALIMEQTPGVQLQTEPVVPNHNVLSNNTGPIALQNNFVNNTQMPPHTLSVIPLPQGLQPQTQPQPGLRSIIERTIEITLNQPSEPSFPELVPICGNCSFECTDFAHLKSHYATVHAYKFERFLFRIVRRVECAYCPFRASLATLTQHHQTNHLGTVLLCRSVIDYNRCGVCHGFFNNNPLSIPLQLPICACPRRQRVLAECLDLNSLRLLQGFGENFFKYACDICHMTFNYEHQCKQHTLQVHKRRNKPKVTSVDSMYVCFSCDESNTLIGEIIEHINRVHLIGGGAEAFGDRTTIYKKIKIIYPKGLTLCVGDLKNTNISYDSHLRNDSLGLSFR